MLAQLSINCANELDNNLFSDFRWYNNELFSIIDKYNNLSPNEAKDILEIKYVTKNKKSSKLDNIALEMEKEFERLLDGKR